MAARHCIDGDVKAGREWVLGEKFGFIEDNCCMCGKDNPNKHDEQQEYEDEYEDDQAILAAAAAAAAMEPTRQVAATAASQTRCTDTVGWANPNKEGCDLYAKERCERGAFIPGHQWSAGVAFWYPEHKCAVTARTPVCIADAGPAANGAMRSCNACKCPSPELCVHSLPRHCTVQLLRLWQGWRQQQSCYACRRRGCESEHGSERGSGSRGGRGCR